MLSRLWLKQTWRTIEDLRFDGWSWNKSFEKPQFGTLNWRDFLGIVSWIWKGFV